MKRFVPFLVLAGILAIPPVVSRLTRHAAAPDFSGEEETLLVLSPHNESIRSEFGEAFAGWYRTRTGRAIRVDWRNVGGANDCVKYLNTRFAADFERREPALYAAPGVPSKLFDPGLKPGDADVDAARTAFAKSECSSGLDIFFGGGADNFIDAAKVGQLVPALSPEDSADLLPAIPAVLRGQPLRDPGGRWHAAALSGFGIIYNRELLGRIAVPAPGTWDDLGDARLTGLLGLADPTKSGTAYKAYEGLVITAMRRETSAGKSRDEAWRAAFASLTRLALNARIWSDSASGPVFDTARGDVAAAMAVDFYGRAQVDDTTKRGGKDRVVFMLPPDSPLSADPVAVLRGAPHAEAARAFVRFVLSPEGQRLWVLPAGTPGGPSRKTLFRLPVRADVYPESEVANPFRTSGEAPVDNRPPVSAALLRLALTSGLLDAREELRHAAEAMETARREGRDDDAARALAVLCGDPAFALPALETSVKGPGGAGEAWRRERIRLADLRREVCRRAKTVAQGGVN